MLNISKLSWELIKEYLDTKYSEFHKMEKYLNEWGKEMLLTYSVLTNEMVWFNDKESFVEDLKLVIEKGELSEKIARNVNNFINML